MNCSLVSLTLLALKLGFFMEHPPSELPHLEVSEIGSLAHLCRIGLVEGEEAALSSDLQRVLQYVRLLEEVDDPQIEPLIQVVRGVTCPMRDDEPGDPLSRDVFLSETDSVAGLVRVPPVMVGYES